MDWIVLAVTVVLASAAWGAWRAAPYIPSRRGEVDALIRLADIQPGQTVFDLGAGDGRLVIAAARAGAKAVGIEIFFIAWAFGVLRIWRLHLQGRAQMRLGDFFWADLHPADAVICYLLPRGMERLRQKLMTELRPGARIVVLGWPMPGWRVAGRIDQTKSSMAAYVYRVPEAWSNLK